MKIIFHSHNTPTNHHVLVGLVWIGIVLQQQINHRRTRVVVHPTRQQQRCVTLEFRVAIMNIRDFQTEIMNIHD